MVSITKIPIHLNSSVIEYMHTFVRKMLVYNSTFPEKDCIRDIYANVIERVAKINERGLTRVFMLIKKTSPGANVTNLIVEVSRSSIQFISPMDVL